MLSATILFVTVPYSAIISGCKRMQSGIGERIGINILIDKPDFDLAVLRDYINDNSYPFIYSISANAFRNAETDLFLSRIYMLFSLSGCFALNDNVIPIVLQDSEQPEINSFINYFQLQGEAIRPALLQQGELQLIHSVFFSNVDQIKMFGEIEFRQYEDKHVSQIVLSGIDVFHMDEQILLIKQIFRENDFCKSFLGKITAKTNENWLLQQLILWEKRSKLYLSFIPLSKQVNETEYYDMRNWYRHEYEILPLWYKRFGHILKVIMGKRTFHSLFKNNVKKYKD